MTAERLLAEHRLGVFLVDDMNDGWKWTCRCGEEADGLTRNRWAQEAADAHLASVLADAERAARADAWDEGYHTRADLTRPIPDWRDFNPYRGGDDT